MACLCGVGHFSGLFDRWVLYAPWLNIPWVMKLRYEDMQNKPAEVAKAFLKYVWERTSWGYAGVAAVPPEMEDEYVDLLVANMKRTEYSPTFREGKSGGWREEFTPAVKDEFKRRCGDWLVRLGYEEDNEW